MRELCEAIQPRATKRLVAGTYETTVNGACVEFSAPDHEGDIHIITEPTDWWDAPGCREFAKVLNDAADIMDGIDDVDGESQNTAAPIQEGEPVVESWIDGDVRHYSASGGARFAFRQISPNLMEVTTHVVDVQAGLNASCVFYANELEEMAAALMAEAAHMRGDSRVRPVAAPPSGVSYQREISDKDPSVRVYHMNNAAEFAVRQYDHRNVELSSDSADEEAFNKSYVYDADALRALSKILADEAAKLGE